MKRGSIYIAGPMTGCKDYNYPAFNAAAKELRADGWDVVNPAELGNSFGTPEELNNNQPLLKRLIAIELQAVADCDAIYLLPGWHESRGATTEFGVAVRLHKEIVLHRVDPSTSLKFMFPTEHGVPACELMEKIRTLLEDYGAWDNAIICASDRKLYLHLNPHKEK